MPPLSPDDEHWHRPGDDPRWREAHYLDFHDQEARVGGIFYGGVAPHTGLAYAMGAIYREDRCLWQMDAHDLPAKVGTGASPFSSGPLQFRLLDAFRHWRIGLDDGAARLAVDWEAVNPPYDYPWAHLVGGRHYEHVGRVTGTLDVAGERIEVRGTGVRDHAWGARAAVPRTSWIWLNALFDDAFVNINLGRLSAGNYVVGYTWRGGDNVPVTWASVHTEYGARGWPVRAEITVRDAKGATWAVEMRVRVVLDLSGHDAQKPGAYLFCLGEFRSGGRTGHGVADYYWAEPASRPDTADAVPLPPPTDGDG